MKRIVGIFLAGIFSAPSAWSADKGASGLSEIQQEAFNVGKNYIESRFLKCDDSLFYKYTWGISAGKPSIFQVLEPEVVLLSGGPISSVDQLNGLEWTGGMKFNFKAIRVLDEKNSATGSWTQWVERPNGINIAYAKSGGQWEMRPSMDGAFADPPATCDEIPIKPPPVKKESLPSKPVPMKPFKI